MSETPGKAQGDAEALAMENAELAIREGKLKTPVPDLGSLPDLTGSPTDSTASIDTMEAEYSD